MTDTALLGTMLIAGTERAGTAPVFHATDPATGAQLQPGFANGGAQDVADACAAAQAAFDPFRETSLAARAGFLEEIGARIMALGDALIDRAHAETGLPRQRLEGERARTVNQLKLFADTVRDGGWVEARIDPARPDRTPLPRTDIRQRHIGVGPVAVFGASNFPLAFSVAGGDTASAFAAGCPVVVKGHPAHPGTSELVGRAIADAVRACNLPGGVFSLLSGTSNELGAALVADARIQSVGFTGSRRGGLALLHIAQARAQPIPVHAEMSSINPVFLLPAGLAARAESIAQGFVASLTMGAGQFCTNPGLIVAVDGPDLTRFLNAARAALADSAAATMLTPGIFEAFSTGLQHLLGAPGVETLARGKIGEGPNRCQAGLLSTDAETFLANPALQEEVFGASSLVVRCADPGQFRQIAEYVEGQLTATLQMDEADHDLARTLLPVLERKAGRILVNGFPTGVEVGHAMVHGGPFPATSDSRTTSVGSLAIRRFLRPVCYDNLPQALLPALLRDGNPAGLWRRIDGALRRD